MRASAGSRSCTNFFVAGCFDPGHRKSGLIHISWLILAAGILFAGAAEGQDLRTQCGTHIKTQAETIDSNKFSYSIPMGGSIDGVMTRDPIGYWAYDQYWEPNISVRLENVGDTPVVNPWIQRAGTPDTRSLKAIVDSIITPDMSDKEKARRIWEYEIHTRFHATTQDDEVADVVKLVNVYGYSLCYDESKDISDLWRAAGLKVRKGYPDGHSVAEVYYDDAWHLLDSDESIIALLQDNETIASETQVVQDHDLTKRTHAYGVLANYDEDEGETSAAAYFWEGERSGEQPSLTRHIMDYTLRPGESITWAWNPANLYHAMPFSCCGQGADYWNKSWRVIAHVMDGDMTYSPDLNKQSNLQYLRTEGVQYKTSGQFGAGLYLTGSTGTVDVPVQSAYAVVGGRLEVDFARLDLDAEEVATAISFDHGKNWTDVWTSQPSDYSRMYVDLNPFFGKTDPARYGYLLRFTLRSRTASPAVVLKGFYLDSTLQMAPLAMPGVELGDNRFIYTDESPGARKVKITHVWNECDANIPIPSAPSAVAPGDGKTVSGTRVKFAWSAGSGPAPSDYEFELSEFPDMRWALSPNFHHLISRTAERGTASYTLTAIGLINPGQVYYWRVRARSQDQVWGPWSKVFSFSASAPAVPVNVVATFDSANRVVRLAWQSGNSGTAPVHFRIYGSQERGFTVSDTAYHYDAGLDGIRTAAANLLLETPTASDSLLIPVDLWRPYYRVEAVDREGRTSGPSALAEIHHPLILTSKLAPAHSQSFYQARVETSASIGHLVSGDEDGKQYQYRYKTGDDLQFSLTGAPDGITIDKTGLISGFIGAAAKSDYDLTVEVKDKNRNTGDSVKLVLQVTR